MDDKVKSGRYGPASDTLIREGLRLLEEEQPLKQQRLTEVRRIDRGIEELDRGEVMLGG